MENDMSIVKESLTQAIKRDHDKLKHPPTWQYSEKSFHQDEEPLRLGKGVIDLSPAWFQQGHDVSPFHFLLLPLH